MKRWLALMAALALILTIAIMGPTSLTAQNINHSYADTDEHADADGHTDPDSADTYADEGAADAHAHRNAYKASRR